MKYSQKKHPLLTLCAFLLLTALSLSCGKKKDNAPEYYIKFKANNEERIYSRNVFAQRNISGDLKNIHRLAFVGQENEMGEGDLHFIMELYSHTRINSSGVFRASDAVSGFPERPQATIAWGENAGGTIQHAVAFPDVFYPGLKGHLTVTIEAFDEKTIRGTFDANAISISILTGKVYTTRVTDGEFYLPLIEEFYPIEGF